MSDQGTNKPWQKGGPSPNPNGRPARRDAHVDRMRLDGWASDVLGYGTSRDKRQASTPQALTLTDDQIRDLWASDDVIQRVIELFPAEAFRKGYEVHVADDKDLGEELEEAAEELDQRSAGDDGVGALERAWQYEAAYGGAAIFPVINDSSADLAEPLDESAIPEIQNLIVFERCELQPSKWYDDLTSPKFRRPSAYRVTPRRSQGAQAMLEIHESRLIIFPGIRTGSGERAGNPHIGWGESLLTACVESVRDFQVGYHGVGVILTDFAQTIAKIKGLAQMVAQGGSDRIANQLILMDKLRSVLRVIPVDAEDDVQRVGTPLSGIPEILDRMANRIAASTGIPVPILMGEVPAGLNATGDPVFRILYDNVARRQRRRTPQVRRLVKLVALSHAGPSGGEIPDGLEIKWCPLWQQSEKEIADARQVQAQTDIAYINAGVLGADEVANSRFGGDDYSFETHIDWDMREKQEAVVPGPADPNPREPAPTDPAAVPIDPATGAPIVPPTPTKDPGAATKDPSDPPVPPRADRMDRLERRGSRWRVLSEAGAVLEPHTWYPSRKAAAERLRQIEAAKAAKHG